MRRILVVGLCLSLLAACSTYKTQVVPFRPPEAYSNLQQFAGVQVAGEAFAESAAAEQAFGFDIRGAGLLPVQLVINNQGVNSLEIVTNQSFLVDRSGQYWPLVSNTLAIERLEKSTQLAAVAAGAGKGAAYGAAGGALIGAALGIVSGQNVGAALGKGAALGAAGGAVVGGAKEGTSPDRGQSITSDLRAKGLDGKTIPADHLASGFLFFPGEATSVSELRLQLRSRETGTIHKVNLKMN
jgi:hypothetical protein